MAAVTELSSVVTEFPGTYKVAAVKVDGATGTTNTLTIDELTAVVACSGALAAAPTAACGYVSVIPNTTAATNVLSCILYKSDLASTSTQTVVDFFVTAIGY